MSAVSTAVLGSTLEDAALYPGPHRCCQGEPAHHLSSLPPVTAKIDDVAGIDYSLLAPPTATAETLDGQLKVRLGEPYTLAPRAPHHHWKHILQ